MGEHSRRLDSWKQIAGYLGRDVRTVMRWAKSSGLPAKRVAGGKGRSVFAFAHELDAWLEGAGTPLSTSTPRGRTRRALTVTVTAGLIVISAGAALALREMKIGAVAPARVLVTPDAVRIVDAGGGEHVIHQFAGSGSAVFARTQTGIADTDADGRTEVLVGVAYYQDHEHGGVSGGELLNFTPRGDARWRFAFDDAIAFADARFGGPWGLAEWQIDPTSSPSRIAVAAHDTVWWPSLVAVIDHTARRSSTFVNPGWIESLLWLDEQRLALGGFNNTRDEAMAALIDTSDTARPMAQAPGSAGTPFECLTCPSDAPLFYATFPRSELNRLTASRFNRAQVSRLADRILVTTIEVNGDPVSATAIYEFDAQLRLRRARFDDAYWDLHRSLELAGRVTHTRAECPERHGPTAIHVWSQAGWERLVPPR